MYEKAATLGGTTAVSGGIVWVPAHDRLPDESLSVEDAVEYLRAQSRGTMDEPLVETFVRTAPTMLDFVEAHTPLDFQVVKGFPDTQPELPGGKPQGGRSLIAQPYEPSGLGEWATRLTALPAEFSGVGFDPKTGSREGGRGGATLVSGLLEGLLARGVEPHLNSRATQLSWSPVPWLVFASRALRASGPCVPARRQSSPPVGSSGTGAGSDVPGRVRWKALPRPGGNEGDGLRMAMAAAQSSGA